MEEVIGDIEAAISEAVRRANEIGDHSAMTAWDSVPCKGTIPTALELITYLGEQVERRVTK